MPWSRGRLRVLALQGEPRKIRSIDWLIVASASVPSLFLFGRVFLPRVARRPCVHLSPSPVRSPPSSLSLTLCVSLSFSVVQRAERNARFNIYIVGGQKCASPECREEFAIVPSRGEEDNRRDACPEGPPGAQDGVPVGLS